VRLSASLVEEYHQLYKTLDIVLHRRSELKSFLKQEDLQKGGKHSDD